ncbi:hypothetical protein RA989_21020, partial [Mycobacteroides abscessus subsp. massiliense]
VDGSPTIPAKGGWVRVNSATGQEEFPRTADGGSERHLSTLLNLKNKAAYTHQDLSSAELKKMNRAAEHLVETAKRMAASRT